MLQDLEGRVVDSSGLLGSLTQGVSLQGLTSVRAPKLTAAVAQVRKYHEADRSVWSFSRLVGCCVLPRGRFRFVCSFWAIRTHTRTREKTISPGVLENLAGLANRRHALHRPGRLHVPPPSRLHAGRQVCASTITMHPPGVARLDSGNATRNGRSECWVT